MIYNYNTRAGTDVARKVVILARECGLDLELSQVREREGWREREREREAEREGGEREWGMGGEGGREREMEGGGREGERGRERGRERQREKEKARQVPVDSLVPAALQSWQPAKGQNTADAFIEQVETCHPQERERGQPGPRARTPFGHGRKRFRGPFVWPRMEQV